jgi:hypothetical protein
MYGDVEDVGSMGKVIDLLFNASWFSQSICQLLETWYGCGLLSSEQSEFPLMMDCQSGAVERSTPVTSEAAGLNPGRFLMW